MMITRKNQEKRKFGVQKTKYIKMDDVNQVNKKQELNENAEETIILKIKLLRQHNFSLYTLFIVLTSTNALTILFQINYLVIYTQEFVTILFQLRLPWYIFQSSKHTICILWYWKFILFALIFFACLRQLIFIYNLQMKVQDNKSKSAQITNYTGIGRGEYELHVLIESTSALASEDSGGVNAKICIKAFGKTEYSKVKSNCGVEQSFWGEHFYLRKFFEDGSHAEHERLQISVYDYNLLLANSLIGTYDIDLQRIYSEKDHTIHHIWLGLSNMEKNFSDIAGYVKLSVSLLGQKDQNIELQVQPLASITKEKKMWVPPQIKRQTYQLIVDIIQGKDIKPADGSTVDSYIGVQFGQIFSVTETIMKNCNPKYETRIFLPLSKPTVLQNISFRLNDFNYIQKVEILGSYYLNINELLKCYEQEKKGKKKKEQKKRIQQNSIPYNQFRWVNFYGPQLDTNRQQHKNIQSFYPQLASYYVGSVLMRVLVQENSQPQTKNRRLTQDDFNQFKLEKAPPFYYKITSRITAALNLFDKNKKHKIGIRVGGEYIETDESPGKNGFCFWNIQKSFTITVLANQALPDLFVYLIDQKNTKICYNRYKLKQGTVLEEEWVRLTPDPAKVTFQKEQAGYLKIGIKMLPNTRKEDSSGRRLNSQLYNSYNGNKKSGRLVIDLLCGQSLMPLDEDGSIDAFFNFSYIYSDVLSSVKNDTLNPVYYQRLVIQADILEQEHCPPIIVNVWDKDKLSNDFLGTSFIDISKAIQNKSLVYGVVSNPQPYWFTITQNGLVTGKFLATFRMLPNFSQTIPRQISLQKAQFDITLVVLGLRSLRNSSVIPVKQPFIQFDFAGLDIYNITTSKEVRDSKLIKTEPKQKGRSVNIASVISTKMALPENYKYWPSLSAKVKDNLLGEFYQPVLGYFTIDLQKSYLRSAQVKKQFNQKKSLLTNNKALIKDKPKRLGAIPDSIILSLRNFVMKSLNYNWKIIQPNISKKLNSIKLKPDQILDQDYIVLFPCYQRQNFNKKKSDKQEEISKNDKVKYIQRFKQIMEGNLEYMKIGFDDKKTRASPLSKRNKHYRFVLNQPYQKYYQRVHGHQLGVMEQIPVKTGKVFLNNDNLSSLIRKVGTEDTHAGNYKGQLFISKSKDINQLDSEDIEFKKQSESLLGLLLKKGKVHMFLYIIQAANLPPKDEFSHSDPYIVIKAGNKKQSFEKQYFEDEPNPQFLKKIHLILDFPQDATIEIEVWDYDPVLADQLIGTAVINVQDRIQAKMVDSRFNNPIQTHNLLHESSKRSQGLIRFWLDLVPIQKISLYRQFQISNQTANDFEARVIIWSVSGMPNNDIEDASDLYVECQFNGDTQSTDVHYRSTTGDGSFNWRMIYPLKMPIKNPTLSLKVFDKDFITKNDCLASVTFSIQRYLEEAYETNSSISLYLGTEDLSIDSEVPGGKKKIIDGKDHYDRFEIHTINKSTENEIQREGKIQISVQILTKEDALKNPAGKGRQVPNQNPFLTNPRGRFQFSLNPMKMISQLCGPRVKRQAALIICLFFCVLLLFYFGLSFTGSLVGAGVSKAITS